MIVLHDRRRKPITTRTIASRRVPHHIRPWTHIHRWTHRRSAHGKTTPRSHIVAWSRRAIEHRRASWTSAEEFRWGSAKVWMAWWRATMKEFWWWATRAWTTWSRSKQSMRSRRTKISTRWTIGTTRTLIRLRLIRSCSLLLCGRLIFPFFSRRTSIGLLLQLQCRFSNILGCNFLAFWCWHFFRHQHSRLAIHRWWSARTEIPKWPRATHHMWRRAVHSPWRAKRRAPRAKETVWRSETIHGSIKRRSRATVSGGRAAFIEIRSIHPWGRWTAHRWTLHQVARSRALLR